MRNVLIGLLGGIIITSLYKRFKGGKILLPAVKEDNEDKRVLLYDSPHKRGRKCNCDTQYCTCGKHIV